MDVVIDDREKNEKIIMEMAEIGMFPIVERLKVGDYKCKKGNVEVVIEMKSIDDFCLSIMDGRLSKQVEAMKEIKHSYVLVYGKLSDRKVEINENCIIGKYISMIMKGVKIVWVDNERQVAYAMKRIFERCIETEGGEKDGEEK